MGSVIGASPLFHQAIKDFLPKKNIVLFSYLAGACVIAICLGEAFTALKVIWVTGMSLLVEDYVAYKSRRAIRESLAVTSGVANAARNRVLIKGGLYLEKISEAECYYLHKTGTLTLESHRVAEIIPRVTTQYPSTFIALAASAEVHSKHPVGRTIVSEALRRRITPTFQGVRTFIFGKEVQ